MVEVIGLYTKLNFAVDLSCGNTVSRNCLPIGILALVIDSIGFPSDCCGLATSSRQDEDLSRRDDSVGGFGNLVVHGHCDCVCLDSSLLRGLESLVALGGVLLQILAVAAGLWVTYVVYSR